MTKRKAIDLKGGVSKGERQNEDVVLLTTKVVPSAEISH